MILHSRYTKYEPFDEGWEHDDSCLNVDVEPMCPFCGQQLATHEAHDCTLSEELAGYDLSAVEWFGVE